MPLSLEMPTSKIIANWKNNVFDAIYWLEGEEPFYIDQVVEYAEKKLLTEAEQAFNLSIFYGKDADWTQIVNACKRYPIQAEKQVVILKEAQHMNQIEKLLSYVEHPLSSTILVVAHKDKNVDGRSALAKALKTKAILVSTKKMYDSKLPEWVNNWVADKGYQISPKAVQIIVDHIGNDLNRIQNELQKLTVNLGDRKKITEDFSREDAASIKSMMKPYLIDSKYLLHYTETDNQYSIKNQGLNPARNPNYNGAEGVFLTVKTSIDNANLPQRLMDLLDDYYDNEEDYDEKPVIRLKIDVSKLDGSKFTWDDDYIQNQYGWNKADSDIDKVIESLDIWGTIVYTSTIPTSAIVGYDFDY